MDDQNKNLILATVLSFVVIMVWFFLFPPPEAPVPAPVETAGGEIAIAPPAASDAEAPEGQPAAPGSAAAAPRVAIDTPRVEGSISLVGGRIDDLSLRDYRETIEPGSPIIRLLNPVGQEDPFYALFGWVPAGTQLEFDDLPGANTLWSQVGDNALTPDTPVVLEWDSPAGLRFTRTIAIDEDYMFSVTQAVENVSGPEVRLAPYGILARHGRPETEDFFILHEGLIQMADGRLTETGYDDMVDYRVIEREGTPAEVVDGVASGWIGFTDKYWMATLIPEPGQTFTAVARFVPGADIYQTETRYPAVTLAPGARSETRTLLFAGAKEWETIRDYQNDLGIDGFLDAIDWGWFFFLTKPIFAVLHWLNAIIGNMGWSIVVLTLLIKAILLPLAWKSYVSMAKMKELQPEMEKIKERAGDDRQKLQQEMMALYRDRKVNPAAGCLPLLLQIPIFFSLYKVIFVTIELRHAEWVGWIRDLSAPDPSSIFNMFGLFPWDAPPPGSFLALIFIGALPIALGLSMWLQMRLNPMPADKTQAMIFAWMPWIFMFMLGGFASGLVIYWIANNMITFGQQYMIMRINGQKPDLVGNIRGSVGKPGGPKPK